MSGGGREVLASPLSPALSPSGEREIRFGGYAAVFDRVDRAGDVVRRGAFGAVAPVPLLWAHGGEAVGEIATIGEDAVGLRVEGVVGGELGTLVRSGAVAGLSVGFRAVRARQGAWRELLAVELVEVSLVWVPMQALARVAWVGDG